MSNQVFLSYAHEDIDMAFRLFNDLLDAGLKPWFDKAALLPGQRWENEIEKAIKQSQYFIALMSTKSLSKRGFVQKEIKRAIDVLDEIAEEDIYILPVRIDECLPSPAKLNKLQWVDLFPSYETGLEKILNVLLSIDPKLNIQSGNYRVFRKQGNKEVKHELIKITIVKSTMQIFSPEWSGSGFIENEKYIGRFKYFRGDTVDDTGTHELKWTGIEFIGSVIFDNGVWGSDDLIWRPVK